MQGKPILVNGDGTPYRSYLYASDLAIWLWTILFKGKTCHAYNVGSSKEITIADLAYLVSNSFNYSLDVHIAKETPLGKQPERYVPSTQRAMDELHLSPSIQLDEAVKRTIFNLKHDNATAIS